MVSNKVLLDYPCLKIKLTPCRDHVCQDHSFRDHDFQDQYCQDHVRIDHVCYYHVSLSQFNSFLSKLIQSGPIWSNLIQVFIFTWFECYNVFYGTMSTTFDWLVWFNLLKPISSNLQLTLRMLFRCFLLKSSLSFAFF